MKKKRIKYDDEHLFRDRGDYQHRAISNISWQSVLGVLAVLGIISALNYFNIL